MKTRGRSKALHSRRSRIPLPVDRMEVGASGQGMVVAVEDVGDAGFMREGGFEASSISYSMPQ